MQIKNCKEKITMIIYKRYKFYRILFAGFFVMLIMMASCVSSKKSVKTSQSTDSTVSQSNQNVMADNKTDRQISSLPVSEPEQSSRIVSKTIEFANGNTLNIYQGETYSESPSGQRLAVLEFGNVGDSLTDLSIYDNNGNKLLEFKIAPMDKIAVADDGRFAAYGFKPTHGIAYISDLMCYDNKGNITFKKENAFGIYHKAVYAPDTDIFIFCACSKDFYKRQEETIIIFDSNYQLLGETVFSNTSEYSVLNEIEYNNTDKQIILYLMNYENKSAIEEKIILNLKGEILKRNEN